MSIRASVCRKIDSTLDRPWLTGSDPPRAEDSPEQPEPEHAREEEAQGRDDVEAQHLRARGREDSDQARADEPGGDNEGDDQAVDDDVQPVGKVVQPLVDEADLDLPVAHLLEDVVELVRVLGEDRGELDRLPAGPREHALRGVAPEHEAARVGPRDLEDVEVGVELDADRGEGRDRLVEDDEASRQPQVERVDEGEDLADHLQRVDLGEARSVVAVEELADLVQELLLALLRVADAEVCEPLGERFDVLVGDVDEEAGRFRDVVVRQVPGEPEVDEPDLIGPEHEDVRGMRIAVEEAVPEDHRHPGLRDHLRQALALLEGVAGLVDVGEPPALDELQRQHPGPRVAPVDARDVDVRMAREVAVERLGIAPLEPVVELLADGARELVDDLADVDEVEGAYALLDDPRSLVEEAEVGFDLLRRARALHLDGHGMAVREDGAVHLADRRRRDRLGVELDVEALDRLAELLEHHALDLLVREGAYVVLEAPQLGDDVRREDVGPHREQLAELDEGRAQLLEELAEVLAAL